MTFIRLGWISEGSFTMLRVSNRSPLRIDAIAGASFAASNPGKSLPLRDDGISFAAILSNVGNRSMLLVKTIY
jgi:hypothetical protein